MIALFSALAGALGVAMLAEVVPLSGAPWPAMWLVSLLLYPVLDAGVARSVPEQFRTGTQVLLFLTMQAIVTYPLGWAQATLIQLGWWGVTLPALGLLLLPALALGLATAPLAHRRWRRSIHGFEQGLPAWLWDRGRLLLSPLFLLAMLISLLEAVEKSPAYWQALERWVGVEAGLAALTLGGGLMVSPFFVLLARRTTSFPAGELRRQLELQTRKLGVSLVSIRVWDQSTQNSVNACAIGLLRGTRMVLFTRGILRLLTDDELKGVFSHELAHLRCRHLPALGAFAMAFILSQAPGELLLGALPTWSSIAVMGGYGAIYWIVGLGKISRRFETEADLVAASTAGYRAYASALGKVALLLGPLGTRRGWRHPSVVSRLKLLAEAEASPRALEQELARCRRLRRGIWSWLAVILLANVVTLACFAPTPLPPQVVSTARIEMAAAYAPVAMTARARATHPGPFAWLARDPDKIVARMTQLAREASAAAAVTPSRPPPPGQP